MGKVERGGSLSGMPAYAEGALYNFQYSGIDLSITDDWKDDYTRDYAGRGVWVQEISGGSRVNPEADGRRIPDGRRPPYPQAVDGFPQILCFCDLKILDLAWEFRLVKKDQSVFLFIQAKRPQFFRHMSLPPHPLYERMTSPTDHSASACSSTICAQP